jgi:hypothetical protein
MTTPEAAHRHLSPRRRRLRHFVLQLLPVTAGILSALLIDGLVERQRERALVRAVRAAIAAEVTANAAALDDRLPSFSAMQDDLGKVTQLVNDILNTGKTDIESFGYSMSLPSLERASWESAERTGSLEYMDYGEVRKYASLYAHQDLVEATQRDLLARLPGLGIIGQAMDSGDPEGYVQDLQDKRADLAELDAALFIYIELARKLAEEYRDISCDPPGCLRQ